VSTGGVEARRNVRTRDYMKLFEELPEPIRKRAALLYPIFCQDPYAPILGNEDLYDSAKGRHRKGSRSIEITKRYRAIYVVDNGVDGKGEKQNCWYWCGSRESYANFIGSR
jgi:hypothetical protein